MRNNFFRSYWFWHCGEGFQTILMMWYMTFHARLSASEIGLYQALQLLPFLIFTAAGGSLTDRIGARTSFVASTGAFALALAFYGLSDPVVGFQPWLFAGYCLLSGVLSAISNPAIDTYIPEATAQSTGQNALLAATVHNIAKLSGNAATLMLPVLSAVGGIHRQWGADGRKHPFPGAASGPHPGPASVGPAHRVSPRPGPFPGQSSQL